MTKYAVCLVVAAGLLGIRSPSAGSFPQAGEEAALTEFDRGVAAYLVIRGEVERTVPSPPAAATAAEVRRVVNARAAAMRVLRAQAKQGDIFTPLVSEVFRIRIADALEASGVTLGDVLLELNENLEPLRPTPPVNAPFRWGHGAAMLPSVIQALPELPPRMEFRFVNWDLVLVDFETGLVVDVLRDALPTPTT